MLSNEQKMVLIWFDNHQGQAFADETLRQAGPPDYEQETVAYLAKELGYLQITPRKIGNKFNVPCYQISPAGSAFLAGLREHEEHEQREERRYQESLNLSKREAFFSLVGVISGIIIDRNIDVSAWFIHALELFRQWIE